MWRKIEGRERGAQALYHSFLNLRFEVRELLTGGKHLEGDKF